MDDGRGSKVGSANARKERKGTPQGAPISPLASNIYMRRFILGWKMLGYAQRFQAVMIKDADDFRGSRPEEVNRDVDSG